MDLLSRYKLTRARNDIVTHLQKYDSETSTPKKLSPIIGGLEERLQLLRVDVVHEPELHKHLLDLEHWIRSAHQPNIPPRRVGVALVLPTVVFAADRCFLLPVGEEVLDVLISLLYAFNFLRHRWAGRGKGGGNG